MLRLVAIGNKFIQFYQLYFLYLIKFKGQAMNIVPVTFKTERIFYIKNIVKELTGILMQDEDLILSMQSMQNSELRVDDLGKPPMEVLWRVTFATKKPHTEFLGPPLSR